jgi:Magnesium chelatase, subunit ChlI
MMRSFRGAITIGMNRIPVLADPRALQQEALVPSPTWLVLVVHAVNGGIKELLRGFLGLPSALTMCLSCEQVHGRPSAPPETLVMRNAGQAFCPQRPPHRPSRGGQSMLARRLTTILPAMTLAEALNTTSIHRAPGAHRRRPAVTTIIAGRATAVRALGMRSQRAGKGDAPRGARTGSSG